jgi:hypothetical protein
MQKAHLYEAIFLVNQGIDQAVRGLERLKRAKDSGLESTYFDESLVLFEDHRARLNAYFCNRVESCEHQDACRFENRHREYQKGAIDEVQVFQDVQALEERRRIEGKPPRLRFFTHEEQREWERQYPRPPCNDASGTHGTKGEET